MSNIIKAIPLEEIISFYLEINESKKYKHIIKQYGFEPKDFIDIKNSTYILWERDWRKQFEV